MNSIICSNCHFLINHDSQFCTNCGFKINVNKNLYSLSLILAPVIVILISSIQVIILSLFAKDSFYIAISIESVISPILTTCILFIFAKRVTINFHKNKLINLYSLIFIGEITGYFVQILFIQPFIIDPFFKTNLNGYGNLFTISVANSLFVFVSTFQFIAILFFVLFLLDSNAKTHEPNTFNLIKVEFIAFLFVIGFFPSFINIIENLFLNLLGNTVSSNIDNFILINNLFYIFTMVSVILLEMIFLKRSQYNNLTISLDHILIIYLIIYLGSLVGNIMDWVFGPMSQIISLLQWNWSGPLYIIISSLISAFTITSYLIFLMYHRFLIEN